MADYEITHETPAARTKRERAERDEREAVVRRRIAELRGA
jgi:hypothetical protein